MTAQKRAQIEASRPMLLQMARENYGLEINPGSFETDSRLGLIAIAFGEAHGKGPAYHKAVMSAYWQQAQDVSDIHVLQELAESVGLPTENFAAELERPEYAAAVDRDVQEAAMYGLNSVPALVFAEKYLVSGAQPYDVLKQVIERVQAES